MFLNKKAKQVFRPRPFVKEEPKKVLKVEEVIIETKKTTKRNSKIEDVKVEDAADE